MFIRLLVSAAVPLVAANLLAGLTGLDDLDGLGRVGGRFLAYFMLTTSLAICLGVAVTTVLSPGTGIALPVASGRQAAGTEPGMGVFLFIIMWSAPVRANVCHTLLYKGVRDSFRNKKKNK